MILLVTLDTNELDLASLARLRTALSLPHELATVTVSGREKPDSTPLLGSISEPLIWGESPWGSGAWSSRVPELAVLGESRLDELIIGSDGLVDILEVALRIISNRSFPAPGGRDHLERGQLRQLRDAMIFEAHVRHQRHVLVTEDTKGFIKHGRRAKLEQLGKTRIMTLDELEVLTANGNVEQLFSGNSGPAPSDDTDS